VLRQAVAAGVPHQDHWIEPRPVVAHDESALSGQQIDGALDDDVDKQHPVEHEPGAKQDVLKNFTRWVSGGQAILPVQRGTDRIVCPPQRPLQLIVRAGTSGPFDGYLTSARVLATSNRRSALDNGRKAVGVPVLVPAALDLFDSAQLILQAAAQGLGVGFMFDMHFVRDGGPGLVKLFDASGGLIEVVGSQGSEDGQFAWPDGVAFDPESQSLFVADNMLSRVQIFVRDRIHVDGFEVTSQGDARVRAH
jgi:DNA-binding transcriptional LysR family regulator